MFPWWYMAKKERRGIYFSHQLKKQMNRKKLNCFKLAYQMNSRYGVFRSFTKNRCWNDDQFPSPKDGPSRSNNHADLSFCKWKSLTIILQIEVPEFGEIYKIRLSLEHEFDWKGWFVDEVVLEDVVTKKTIKFKCKRYAMDEGVNLVMSNIKKS